MLTFTALSPRAIAIVAEGHFTAADVMPALERLAEALDAAPKLDILADVRGSPSVTLGAVVQELKRWPLIIRLVRALGRVAIVADAEWVRTLSRIEGNVLRLIFSGVEYEIHYEVYARKDEAHARAWLLRETDQPRP